MVLLRFRHHAVPARAVLTAVVLASGLLMFSVSLLRMRWPSIILAGQQGAQVRGNAAQRIRSMKDNVEMILIPSGPFVYGIDQKEVKRIVIALKSTIAASYGSELPRTTKDLDSFYIDRYEVTNEQYSGFVRETSHREPRYSRYPQLNGSRQPVVGVGWEDAKAYCSWAGFLLGRLRGHHHAHKPTCGQGCCPGLG